MGSISTPCFWWNGACKISAHYAANLESLSDRKREVYPASRSIMLTMVLVVWPNAGYQPVHYHDARLSGNNFSNQPAEEIYRRDSRGMSLMMMWYWSHKYGTCTHIIEETSRILSRLVSTRHTATWHISETFQEGCVMQTCLGFLSSAFRAACSCPCNHVEDSEASQVEGLCLRRNYSTTSSGGNSSTCQWQLAMPPCQTIAPKRNMLVS